MHNPIHIIDTNAEAVTRSLDIMVYSLEGLYEKIARENPTPSGLREFWMLSANVVEESMTLTMTRLQDGIDALKASLSDSERIHSEQVDDSENFYGVAYDSFGAFFAQARIAYAKRLREIVAARAFGYDTFNPDPRIMARNGRRWNFSEYAYLNSRQLMVDWYNGVKISNLAAQGVKEFNLLTDDPELIYSTYKVEDYPSIAAELFHPRTTKLVGGPHVST